MNIGDVLMYMSDDRLKSNFHRIPAPNADRYQGRRVTMAYFTNPNLNAVLQVTYPANPVPVCEYKFPSRAAWKGWIERQVMMLIRAEKSGVCRGRRASTRRQRGPKSRTAWT